MPTDKPTDDELLNDPGLLKWHAKGQHITLGGQSVFVIDEAAVPIEAPSELPTLLLIHGFPTSCWDWAPMWESLLKHYRLVCLDLLGFGFSDKPDRRDYTIHRQADLIDELVARLKLKEYHVIAHDYGVSVAQELLARQLELGSTQNRAAPNKVGQWLSCTLLNGGLFPETHKALLIQKLLLSPIGKYVNALTGFPQFSRSFRKVFGAATKPSQLELTQFWEIINFNSGRHVFHNLITYMNDRVKHRERWVTALQTSTIPIALINGSVDPISGKHLVARYQQLNCRLDYIDELSDIGHYPHVEAADRVSESVLRFLDSLN